MSGLVKPKKYDWKDSNLAMFGSDTEKAVKKESAESEEMWQGVGQEVGLEIFRIVNFQVTKWPKEDYGSFYDGDSYIILNTYKQDPSSEALDYDVHFWIGGRSSQDEYGTAAYKTVELDTYLDDQAVQYRETQGHESDLFMGYFNNVTIMSGGAESGFRHVTPEEYKPRLLRFCKKGGRGAKVVLWEVPLCRSKVDSGDVFILDLGKKLYQWNGAESNKDEKYNAMLYLNKLKGERGACSAEVLEQNDTPDDHEFYTSLTGEDEGDDTDGQADEEGISQLYRVSDSSGALNIDKVKEGDISLSDFATEDVFVLDKGNAVFVWVGKGASPTEKKNGFGIAQKHLSSTSHQLANIVVVKEGQNCQSFMNALAA